MKIIITESQFKNLLNLINESYIKGVNDNEIITATIIGEAGGEDDEGMKAIYNVLKNRAKNKGTSAAGEALRPKQFSMWDSATQNVSTRDDFDINRIKVVIDKMKSHPKWNEALNIIKTTKIDNTNGATHYYAHKGVNKIGTPSFAKNWTELKDIGNHKFGRI